MFLLALSTDHIIMIYNPTYTYSLISKVKSARDTRTAK